LVSGYTKLHRALERDIARWEGFDDALVFSSGFAANLGTISSLVHPKDLILSDSLNHASIIDGCRFSRATLRFFKHKDCDHLQNLIFRNQGKFRKLWIVSDTLFSMDGDFAPIEKLYELTLKNDAMLILDEAHATGVTGDGARGLTDVFPIDSDWKSRIIKLGTLSKALASQGGFVCANKKIIKLIKNKARSYIFSTALSPVCVAAARTAIKLINKDDTRRDLVISLSNYLRKNLVEMGLDIGPSESHIIPVIFGNTEKTMRIAKHLLELGFLVPPIRPPSVPVNSSRLRISVTAFHTYDLINDFLLKLKVVLSQL
jgi:8-amino-7-oxononanoate synthase